MLKGMPARIKDMMAWKFVAWKHRSFQMNGRLLVIYKLIYIFFLGLHDNQT
jgi:hypothetical protein